MRWTEGRRNKDQYSNVHKHQRHLIDSQYWSTLQSIPVEAKWIILSDVDITNTKLIWVLRKVDIWLIYQSSSVKIFPLRKRRLDFMPPLRKLHLSFPSHLMCPGTTCLTRKIMFLFLWFFPPQVWHDFFHLLFLKWLYAFQCFILKALLEVRVHILADLPPGWWKSSLPS